MQKRLAHFFLEQISTFIRGFKDPSEATGDEESILKEFRRVRDEIKAWIEETFGDTNGSLKSSVNLLK